MTLAHPDDRQGWTEAVVYQLFPRSFNDTTGSRSGDLAGITEKLDYPDHAGLTRLLWTYGETPSAGEVVSLRPYEGRTDERRDDWACTELTGKGTRNDGKGGKTYHLSPSS